MDFYLPTLRNRNKWQETVGNLKIRQLVLVGDTEDLLTKGKYRVGRVAETFPQMHHGKPIVRRAKIAVTNFDSGKGIYVVDHIFRDISKIVPVGLIEP